MFPFKLFVVSYSTSKQLPKLKNSTASANSAKTATRPVGSSSGVATQYTALGFLHEMPPPLNTGVKAE